MVLEVGRECEAVSRVGGWSSLVACKVKLLRLYQSEPQTGRILQYTLNNVYDMVIFVRLEDESPNHITASDERLCEEDGRLTIDLEIRKIMKIAETHSQKLRHYY